MDRRANANDFGSHCGMLGKQTRIAAQLPAGSPRQSLN